MEGASLARSPFTSQLIAKLQGAGVLTQTCRIVV
jgi:hypothetical protein